MQSGKNKMMDRNGEVNCKEPFVFSEYDLATEWEVEIYSQHGAAASYGYRFTLGTDLGQTRRSRSEEGPHCHPCLPKNLVILNW